MSGDHNGMSNAWEERKKALEEEYFRRKDREAIAGLRRQEQAATQKNCPDCGRELCEERFQNAQLLRCRGCGGVWVSEDALAEIVKDDRRAGLTRWIQRHLKNSSKREV